MTRRHRGELFSGCIALLLIGLTASSGWPGLTCFHPSAVYRAHAVAAKPLGLRGRATPTISPHASVRVARQASASDEFGVAPGNSNGGSSGNGAGGGAGGDPPDGARNSDARPPDPAGSDAVALLAAVAFACVVLLAICAPIYIIVSIIKRCRRRQGRTPAPRRAELLGSNERRRIREFTGKPAAGIFVLVLLSLAMCQGLLSSHRKAPAASEGTTPVVQAVEASTAGPACATGQSITGSEESDGGSEDAQEGTQINACQVDSKTQIDGQQEVSVQNGDIGSGDGHQITDPDSDAQQSHRNREQLRNRESYAEQKRSGELLAAQTSQA